MAKILIVDDSGLSRRMMRKILESAGHEVVEAEDGVSAIEQYYLQKPDVVFLDLTMQGMDGWEVLANLRRMDEQARVVIATADIQKSTRTMADEYGAAGFINKPFESKNILDALDALLAKDDR
ncbi:MAG: response regulator [Acidobacteriota bacterium]